MGAEHLNRRGRPKGSKNRLSEEFLSKLADDFTKHGADVIVKVRTGDPVAYLKVVASMTPKDLDIHSTGDLSLWTDGQLEEEIRRVYGEMGQQIAAMDAVKGQVIEALPDAVRVINTGVPRGDYLPDKFPAVASHFSRDDDDV